MALATRDRVRAVHRYNGCSTQSWINIPSGLKGRLKDIAVSDLDEQAPVAREKDDRELDEQIMGVIFLSTMGVLLSLATVGAVAAIGLLSPAVFALMLGSLLVIAFRTVFP